MQKGQKIKGFPGLDPCILTLRDRIPEALHGQVTACVLSIVVIVCVVPGGGITGNIQPKNAADPGGADVFLHQLTVIILFLTRHCHLVSVDATDPVGGTDPGIAFCIKCDGIDLIVC